MLLSELSALGSRVLRMRQLTLSLRSVTTFVVPDSEDEDEKKGRLAREKVLTPRLPQGLPKPDDFEVKSAQLVNKSVSLHRCPPPLKPEFAFIGHSNVGKSSLINMLAREEVTLTSSKPGRTRSIQHILVNNRWYLVDLPGYGYARVSRQDRNRFRDFTQHYILNRVSLAHVFLLVDSGARPVSMDVECALWLHTSNVPYTVLYTKTDSRAEGAPPPEENIPTFQRALKAATRSPPPPYLTTSAKSGAGREDVLRYISQLKQAFKMPLQLKGVPHGEE